MRLFCRGCFAGFRKGSRQACLTSAQKSRDVSDGYFVKRGRCTSSSCAMEKGRTCSPCGPGCRELDPREPREVLFAEDKAESQTAVVSVSGLATGCSCTCTSSSDVSASLPTSVGVATSASTASASPNAAVLNHAASGRSCSSTPSPTASQGGLSTSGPPGISASYSMPSDTVVGKSACTNTPTVPQGASTSLGSGQSSGGGSTGGGGASRIRRLLRGRAHSSHGGTSSNANCGAHGEERTTRGGQLAASCRGRNTISNIRNGRPSASKSTSSLLDASSVPSASASCCGATTSSSAIWTNSNSSYTEVMSLAVAIPPLTYHGQYHQHQQELSPTPSGSLNNTNIQAPATTTPHKTKNKVGSWALKLCKRSSPGSSNASANSTNSSTSSQVAAAQGAAVESLATHCANASTPSKSTNSSPSKGSAPLGYSVCHQGGFSASLPLAPPQENIHHRYHYHQHHNHHHQNQHESATSAQLNNEVLCVCCTAGTSRDLPGGILGTSNNSSIAVCGVPTAQSSGTPNATRRRMATAIINQLSSSSSVETNDGNQGPPALGVFGSLSGSDDLDERARIERAREIAEGVDPPPGFIRAHEVIPDDIAAALRSLNLDALPWDVLGKIWDLNPSPHQIPLSLVAVAAAGHGLPGPVAGSSAGNSNSGGALGTTVHTTVDYMHCLVPDLAQISRCGFYWGKMDRYEAERLLQKKPEGSFLLRDSAQEEYLFSVSFRRYGRSLHARIEQWNHNFSFDSHDPGVFSSPTVCGLIEHYKDPACCMYFEPMLTIPINRNFPFSLQHLARCAITERVSYDDVSRLHLPKPIKAYLREYHYKQRLRVRNVERE